MIWIIVSSFDMEEFISFGQRHVSISVRRSEQSGDSNIDEITNSTRSLSKCLNLKTKVKLNVIFHFSNKTKNENKMFLLSHYLKLQYIFFMHSQIGIWNFVQLWEEDKNFSWKELLPLSRIIAFVKFQNWFEILQNNCWNIEILLFCNC